MILLSGNIRLVRILAGIPREGGVKRQWGCRQRQFSAFSLVASSETLEVVPALLCSDTQSVVVLNGYFALNSVFAAVWLDSDRANFENNLLREN